MHITDEVYAGALCLPHSHSVTTQAVIVWDWHENIHLSIFYLQVLAVMITLHKFILFQGHFHRRCLRRWSNDRRWRLSSFVRRRSGATVYFRLKKRQFQPKKRRKWRFQERKWFLFVVWRWGTKKSSKFDVDTQKAIRSQIAKVILTPK